MYSHSLTDCRFGNQRGPATCIVLSRNFVEISEQILDYRKSISSVTNSSAPGTNACHAVRRDAFVAQMEKRMHYQPLTLDLSLNSDASEEWTVDFFSRLAEKRVLFERKTKSLDAHFRLSLSRDHLTG